MFNAVQWFQQFAIMWVVLHMSPKLYSLVGFTGILQDTFSMLGLIQYSLVRTKEVHFFRFST